MFSEEVINEFFSSLLGKSITAVVTIILIGLFIINLYKKRNLSVKALAYSGIAIALATILSYIKLFQLPQGGAVTTFLCCL